MTSLISRWRVETVFRSLLSIFVVASPICHTHLQESSDLVLIGSNSTGSYRLTGSQIDSADTNLSACLTWLIDSAHAAGFMLAIWQSHWLKMPCIALRGPSSVHRRRCQSEVLHIFLFSYIVSMLLFFFALCVCALVQNRVYAEKHNSWQQDSHTSVRCVCQILEGSISFVTRPPAL